MRRAERVTDADWRLGDEWYDRERAWMADEAEATGHTADGACAAFAAMSPRTQYGRNRTALLDLLHGRPVRGVLPANVPIAQRALIEGPSACTGPKTSAFASNLCGDLDRVTVDIWMMRVYGSPLQAPTSRSHYARIERAFQGAAGRLDVAPRTLQAALWFHVRGDKPSDPDWRS